jgi:hypothetical protein
MNIVGTLKKWITKINKYIYIYIYTHKISIYAYNCI